MHTSINENLENFRWKNVYLVDVYTSNISLQSSSTVKVSFFALRDIRDSFWNLLENFLRFRAFGCF